MCGEHVGVLVVARVLRGSSPHVRGAPVDIYRFTVVLGIIPACAGSTYRKTTRKPRGGDHPRMCGEHTANAPTPKTIVGSSPHVRGARTRVFDSCEETGIIPACAGSTRESGRWPRTPWDHPRMCGEHFLVPSIGFTGEGSSPHVRGALVDGDFMEAEHGIIPACAGSTSCRYQDN